MQKLLDDDRNLLFGKYYGQNLYEVVVDDPDYLTWLLRKGDLPQDVADEIEEALNNG